MTIQVVCMKTRQKINLKPDVPPSVQLRKINAGLKGKNRFCYMPHAGKKERPGN